MAFRSTSALFRSVWKISRAMITKRDIQSCSHQVENQSKSMNVLNRMGRTPLGTVEDLVLQDAKAPLASFSKHQNDNSQSNKAELHNSLKSSMLLSQVFSRYSNSLSWLYFNHDINGRSNNSTPTNSDQQIQLSSVMKKRRKKIKLHKLKKRRRRDRFKVKR